MLPGSVGPENAYFVKGSTRSAEYAFIQYHWRVWPMSVQCQVRGQRGRASRALCSQCSDVQWRHLSDDALSVHIKTIHAEARSGYGWPRI